MSKTNHLNYIEYEKMIKKHSNYKDLPHKETWVATGNSKKGQERKKWWELERKNLGLDHLKTLAETCREIHPTKIHVCQVCGEGLNVYYIYPNKNSLKKVNRFYKKNGVNEIVKPYETDIYAILDNFENLNLIEEFKDIFEIKVTSSNKYVILKEIENIKKTKNSKLSPGAMSNCPDRLDGFHSYSACCRPKEDKGRSKENLQKYGEDRRAYESWSSGNWKKASWLMKKINTYTEVCPEGCDKTMSIKKKMTADHIGPISLGFAHTTIFQPMCQPCNSAKNNRMTEKDYKKALFFYKSGEEIISWFMKKCWDKIIKIENIKIEDLRNILRENFANILTIFAEISNEGYYNYLLRFLNPQFAFYTFEFDKTIPFNEICTGKGIISKVIKRTENYNNSLRYIQKSFSALDSYYEKDNRKINLIKHSDLNKKLLELKDTLVGTRNDINYESFEAALKKGIEADSVDPIVFFEEYKQIGKNNINFKYNDLYFKDDEAKEIAIASFKKSDEILEHIFETVSNEIIKKYTN